MNSTKKLQRLFRSFLKELRHIELKQQEKKNLVWQSSPMYKYVKDKFVFPASSLNNTLFLEQYTLLLNAIKVSQGISAMYKGAGERTIEQSANLVGLKLPKLYVDPIKTS
ncbi:protein FMC1 homolog isoform X2 [Hydra vulgaris]|uniref:Protein FMC1 homolog n=1 Tax=Hydra vulgaris TaxID=6087 RepID=A0ABM4CWU1_HYDVU